MSRYFVLDLPKLYQTSSDDDKIRYYVAITEEDLGEVVNVLVLDQDVPVENVRVEVFYSRDFGKVDETLTDELGQAKFFLQKGFYDIKFSTVQDDLRFLRDVETSGIKEFDVTTGVDISGTLRDRYNRRLEGFVRLFFGQRICGNKMISDDGNWSFQIPLITSYGAGLSYGSGARYGQDLSDAWLLKFDRTGYDTIVHKVSELLNA